MPLGGLAVVGGLAAVKGISGLFKSHKANQMEAENKRPTYTIPPEYFENAALAKQMAQTGMPTQQYNNAINGINGNLAAGLNSLNRSYNPSAGVASSIRAATNAKLGLDAQDAATRINNQRFFIGQNSALGAQKLGAQDDVFRKYEENAAAIRGLKAAAAQEKSGALDLAAGGLLQYMSSKDGGDDSSTNGYQSAINKQSQNSIGAYPNGIYPNGQQQFAPIGWGTLSPSYQQQYYQNGFNPFMKY